MGRYVLDVTPNPSSRWMSSIHYQAISSILITSPTYLCTVLTGLDLDGTIYPLSMVTESQPEMSVLCCSTTSTSTSQKATNSKTAKSSKSPQSTTTSFKPIGHICQKVGPSTYLPAYQQVLVMLVLLVAIAINPSTYLLTSLPPSRAQS